MPYPTAVQIEKARQANLAEYFIQNGYEVEQNRAFSAKRIMRELHVKGYA